MEVTRKKDTGTGSAGQVIGLGEFTVIAVNPTNEQRAKLFGRELSEDDEKKEETKYEDLKDTNGDEQVIVEFWIKSKAPESVIKSLRFYLVDKLAVSKEGKDADGNEKTIKNQYVNQCGESAWGLDKSSLQPFFTNFTKFGSDETFGEKEVRQAIAGEADLYAFLKVWLSNVNFKDAKASNKIFLDKKKMFNNLNQLLENEIRPIIDTSNEIETVRESLDKFFTMSESLRKEMKDSIGGLDLKLKELRKDCLCGSFVALAYVQSKEKDGEVKHIQKFYREFLPVEIGIKTGNKWNNVNTIKALTTGNLKDIPVLKKFVEKIEDPAHGIKDSYAIVPMMKFNADTFQQASNDLFRDESGEDDKDYHPVITNSNEALDDLPF